MLGVKPKIDIFDKGHLHDELWNLVDKNEAYLLMTDVFDLKEHNTRWFLATHKELLELNKNLIEIIEKEMKQ